MQKTQRGQTLIEAMVALVVILMILTAISIVIVNGLYNSRFIKNQNEANKYAQQGIELVRNIQKNDLNTFKTFESSIAPYLCIDEANSTLTSTNCSDTGVNTGTSYNRTIEFSPPGGECDSTDLKVTVTVRWSSTKCPASTTFCHKSVLVSCMQKSTTQSDP